jgi:hypothetical protein
MAIMCTHWSTGMDDHMVLGLEMPALLAIRLTTMNPAMAVRGLCHNTKEVLYFEG